MNTTSTSAQLIHLFPDTAYDIQVQPKLNNGEEGQLDTTSGTTDVSRIEVTVNSKTFISVAYTLPEDEPSSNQQIRLGHFGSTLQTFGNQPVNNMGNVLFPSFPAVSPGDLLYASNAPSDEPTNYLNEIHFRYHPNPPQNVMVNPSSCDAFEVTFDLPATGGNYDGFKIRVNDEVRETLMGSAKTSVIINGLAPNTPYTFNVTSFVGIGGDEAESEIFSDTRILGQYDNNEPYVSSTSNTNLQVNWLDAATNGQQVCLKELCSNLRGDTPMCLPTNQTCPLFYTFEGLVPGRRYVVYVEYNDGTVEDVIFTQTKPNPPESLSATALGSDEIRVLLSPPQGEFDGYELSFSPSTGGPILLEPDTREHLLDNLQSDTTYNIQVFAYSGGNGQRLEGDAISTTATTDEEILVATNIKTNQIIVLWSAEMLDVNSFQTFRLSYSSMESDSILIPKDAMSTSNEYGHSVTDLVPGDLVTFNLETVTLSGQATLVDTIVRRTSEFNTKKTPK
ncbi:fibronectin-like [Strongylocentrotus purpuratus]|uniref:Fibronectin type-III domain-containing protein n=1 Tax=Strongylocentrotus purpuratus TaxID=7668 RepID=A0A7M7P150_STRPU|nr:fibronectin-like [Strongylocentrotus purpuratus]